MQARHSQDVAVGVLADEVGRALIAQRPDGSHQAGWWEFPGGKIHQTETPLQGLIRELREEGKTIIFSTHIMSEAEKLCDRIAIIHHGRILAMGTLEEHRQATGQHYLEDIFVHEVMAAEGGEDATAGAGASAESETSP